MRRNRVVQAGATGVLLVALSACGHSGRTVHAAPARTGSTATPGATAQSGTATPSATPVTHTPTPTLAHADHVIGTGTPASCTSAAVVSAVAAGGVIAFNCGDKPATITMTQTARIRNSASRVLLDGGGRVTLSGGGAHRILYLNTCDESLGHVQGSCIAQTRPALTVQNLTFADADATGQHVSTPGGIGGGAAIFAYGGGLTVRNSRFVNGRCDRTGPDIGGAAIRIVYQPRPAQITHSSFTGGVCSNGGALSSLHASWAVDNSVFASNQAVGRGANPARGGTPGGGSGGAVYGDGDDFTMVFRNTVFQYDHANEGGGAIFMVSNDRTGTLTLTGCTLRHDVSAGFETVPGIFFQGSGSPRISQ